MSKQINISSQGYINQRPVDNVNLSTFQFKFPVAKYYRKTSSCCDNQTTQIIKNNKCIRPTYSGNTVLNKKYYASNSQYLKSKCQTYQQNNSALSFNPSDNSAKPNCTNSDCNSTTYKKNNKKFGTQGAVSSGSRLARLKYNTIQTVSRYNPRQSNYTGNNSNQNYIHKDTICKDC